LASGGLSSITVVGATDSSATFGNITGEAGKIGDITVSQLSTGFVDFGTIGSSSAVGSIAVTLAGEGSADFGNIIATGGTVGDITLNVGGSASADFANVAATTIGNITVSGSGWVDFGAVTATTVGGIDLRNQGSGGTFSINLAGVANGVVVDGGRGTTTIVSGDGNDEFYLKTGLGTDTVTYSSATDGIDSVYRFQAGSSDDKIAFDVSEFATGLINSDGSAIDAASTMVFGTASGASVTLGASADIILFTTAYATTAALITDAASDITLGTGTLTSGDLIALWTDGVVTNVSLIHFEEGASAAGGIIALASASGITVNTIAVLNGVTPGALVAANFDAV
jgi:hypothetical protein